MRRPFARAYSNANRTIRRVPATEMGFSVMPASSRTSNPASSRSFSRSAAASARAALELDALVEVLGVLPDHDQVRLGMADRDAGERARGTHRREQVELLAERHVHAPEPGADRRRDRSLQRDAALADRVERRLGQERAVRLQRAGAGDGVDPLDVAVRGVQHQPGRGRDLRPDAVSGDERDAVSHRASLAVRPTPTIGSRALAGAVTWPLLAMRVDASRPAATSRSPQSRYGAYCCTCSVESWYVTMHRHDVRLRADGVAQCTAPQMAGEVGC